MADLPSYPGTPRWVKITGTVFGVLVLLTIIMTFADIGGPHGPGRHGFSDNTSTSDVAKKSTSSEHGHQ